MSVRTSGEVRRLFLCEYRRFATSRTSMHFSELRTLWTAACDSRSISTAPRERWRQ